MIKELCALDRRDVAMRAWDIDDAGPPGVLFALYKYIGSLKRACLLARVSRPPRRRFDDPWDEDSVIDAIRSLHRAGKSVAMSKVDHRLYAAGRKFFGTWREAIETAGLDYNKVRLVRDAYTRKEVIALLRRLARKPRAWRCGAYRTSGVIACALHKDPSLGRPYLVIEPLEEAEPEQAVDAETGR